MAPSGVSADLLPRSIVTPRVSLSVFVIPALAFLMACGQQESAVGPVEESADEAFALLEQADRAGFNAAFARLGTATHLETLRLEQIGEDGQPVAFAERRYLHSADGVQLSHADSAGVLDLGAFGGRGTFSPTDPFGPLDRVLGSDPAFLDARSREDFVYQVVGDTMMYDLPARIVSVSAREDAGRDRVIRLARFYVQPEDGHIHQVYVERVSNAMLLGESTTLFASLQPGPDGPIPARVVTETRLRPPLTSARTMRLSRTFQPITGMD